jgi:hypothetical protein
MDTIEHGIWWRTDDGGEEPGTQRRARRGRGPQRAHPAHAVAGALADGGLRAAGAVVSAPEWDFAKEEAIVAAWSALPGRRCGLSMEPDGFVMWDSGVALVEDVDERPTVMFPWGNPCCALGLEVDEIIALLVAKP